MYISKIFVTVDILISKANFDKTEILLIKRKNEPYKDFWALPGGFVDEDEDLETAAKRELFEETTIRIDSLKQIGAYGTPNRDPRSHVVSIAFFGEVESRTEAKAADDAKEAKWFDISNLPPTAFDHSEIIKDGLQKFYIKK
nr:NUDIX hydrolase [uncultured Flavobacterium sp.]